MAEERNTLTWPSIEQLPRAVCSKIARFFQVAELAATVIQRRRRGRPSPLDGKVTLKGGHRQSLHRLCTLCPVAASEKLDGTNVGKLRCGTLLGRRLTIEQTATSYQRCDLTSLREVDVDAAIGELVSLATGETGTEPVRAAIYGELMCNVGLFNYKANGLAKSWQAFGAVLEFASEEVAAAYATAASASGLACTLSGDRAVRIGNNEAFGEVLRRHRVPVIATVAFGSLCEAISSQRAWMTGEHGEGLVLSIQKAGRSSAYKWKISREPQPAAVSELTELLEAFANGAGGKAVLIDQSIHEMIGNLHAVSTHVDSARAPAATKQKKEARQAAVDTEAVAQAIASALTKFDALEVTFEAEGKEALNKLAERLCAEVLSDPDLATGDADEAAARREQVKVSVKRHVGQAFGAWQKSRHTPG